MHVVLAALSLYCSLSPNFMFLPTLRSSKSKYSHYYKVFDKWVPEARPTPRGSLGMLPQVLETRVAPGKERTGNNSQADFIPDCCICARLPNKCSSYSHTEP